MNGKLKLHCLVNTADESELAKLWQFLPGLQRHMWSCIILMEDYAVSLDQF